MNDFEQSIESLANDLFGSATETEVEETEVEVEETETETEEVEYGNDMQSEGTNSADDDEEEIVSEETTNHIEEEVSLPNKKGAQNKAFAQMRKQLKEMEQENNQFKTILSRLADAKGVDLKSLLGSLEDESDKVQAEKQNIDPQMYRRIRQLEEAEQARSREASQERFSRRLVEFNQQAKLSDADLKQFFQDAADNGFDLINSNINFMQVYRGLYHDKLTAKKEEEIRQAELARQKRAQQSTSTVTKKKGSTTSTQTGGDLNSILNDLSKTFKMKP